MARSKVSKISLDKSIILFRLEVRPQKRFRNKLAIQSLSSGRIKNAVLKGQMIKSMTLVAQVDNYLGASTIQHLREQNIKHQNIGIRIGWLSENRLNHSEFKITKCLLTNINSQNSQRAHVNNYSETSTKPFSIKQIKKSNGLNCDKKVTQLNDNYSMASFRPEPHHSVHSFSSSRSDSGI